jgi:phosphoserine phosphatase
MNVHDSQALVLIASPGSAAIDTLALKSAREQIGPQRILAEDWLKPGEAWQAILTPAEDNTAGTLACGLAAELGSQPIDVNVVRGSPAERRKRLLIADMDSTIIEQECIDELADIIGIKAKVAEITDQAMRGEIDFEPALRERVALLAGIDTSTIDRIIAERINMSPGADQLVATMRAHGAHAALVSGGFTLFTTRIAEALGFDSQHANALQIENGRLTGKVVDPILGREAKRETLIRLSEGLGLDLRETLAVGDGANDLAMIETAGLGVAYRAKPAVAALADARIVHGDLTALLYLQGYTASDLAL